MRYKRSDWVVKATLVLFGFKKLLLQTTERFLQGALQSIAITYLSMLVVAIPAPSSKICRVLQHVDPSYVCTLVRENPHADDCRFWSGNIYLVLDRFIVAHFIGWTVKALLIPHRGLLWSASFTFEIVERILVPLLPSLRECWWDSFVLDVAVCNAIGIELGLQLARKLNLSVAFNKQKYSPLSHKENIGIVVALVATDIIAFPLKHVLQIHSASPLNVYRILFFVALTPFCVRHHKLQVLICKGGLVHVYMLVTIFEYAFVLLRWPNHWMQFSC